MPNPFLFGKIVTGEHFCNRFKEIRLLTDNLMSGQSIVVLSPRRMGKSSLLAVAASKLNSMGIVSGRIDFFASKSVFKIINEVVSVCAQMILSQENNIEKFIKKASEIFTKTRITIEPTLDGTGLSIKPSFSLPVDAENSLSESILGLDDFLGKKKKRGLIVMDEFQEILSVDRVANESLEAQFRSLIQSTKNLSFTFIGSHASVLSSMFTDRNRPFFNSAKIIELGPIDRKSIDHYVKERFKSAGIVLEDSDAIFSLTQGHPDYTQRLCSHLFDILKAKRKRKFSHADSKIFHQAMLEMIEACEMIFIPEWEGYSLRQQQVISILAEKGPHKRFPSIYLAEYEMGNTTLNTVLKDLLRKGTVRKNKKDEYELSDPVFAKWIKKSV